MRAVDAVNRRIRARIDLLNSDLPPIPDLGPTVFTSQELRFPDNRRRQVFGGLERQTVVDRSNRVGFGPLLSHCSFDRFLVGFSAYLLLRPGGEPARIQGAIWEGATRLWQRRKKRRRSELPKNRRRKRRPNAKQPRREARRKRPLPRRRPPNARQPRSRRRKRRPARRPPKSEAPRKRLPLKRRPLEGRPPNVRRSSHGGSELPTGRDLFGKEAWADYASKGVIGLFDIHHQDREALTRDSLTRPSGRASLQTLPAVVLTRFAHAFRSSLSLEALRLGYRKRPI